MKKIIKKIQKVINVNADKCSGCRACELACSAFHATPKYSISNPARSRIKVYFHERENLFLPIYASEYTEAECKGHRVYTIDGRTHSECTLCGAACPWRDIFKEPDSGLPLKCDMCEDKPPIDTPMCVQACLPGCLTYEEKEVEAEVDEEEQSKANVVPEDMEVGLDALVKKYGEQAVTETLNSITQGKIRRK